jgi:hypothetical protein
MFYYYFSYFMLLVLQNSLNCIVDCIRRLVKVLSGCIVHTRVVGDAQYDAVLCSFRGCCAVTHSNTFKSDVLKCICKTFRVFFEQNSYNEHMMKRASMPSGRISRIQRDFNYIFYQNCRLTDFFFASKITMHMKL